MTAEFKMFTANNSIIYPDCLTDETELTISKVITDQDTASYYLTYEPLNPEELYDPLNPEELIREASVITNIIIATQVGKIITLEQTLFS